MRTFSRAIFMSPVSLTEHPSIDAYRTRNPRLYAVTLTDGAAFEWLAVIPVYRAGTFQAPRLILSPA